MHRTFIVIVSLFLVAASTSAARSGATSQVPLNPANRSLLLTLDGAQTLSTSIDQACSQGSAGAPRRRPETSRCLEGDVTLSRQASTIEVRLSDS